MNIKMLEGFLEVANVGIAEIAVLLNGLFKKYEQLATIEEAEQVSPGQVIMPILAFEPLRLWLKSNAIKNTFVNGRFAVYSKQPDSPKPCLRFILEERCHPREEVMKQIPPMVRDGTIEKDGEETLGDILLKLGSIKSDKVSYFYSSVTCEGLVSHCIAVVHEFGPEGNSHCIATAYLKVDVSK